MNGTADEWNNYSQNDILIDSSTGEAAVNLVRPHSAFM